LQLKVKKTKDMPTVFTLFGYRFWFYGNDHTPIHIHVKKGGSKDNEEVIAQHWNTFFWIMGTGCLK